RTVSPGFLPGSLSTWAAWSGTSGNLSPTLTLMALSWAEAVTHRHRAAARPAARAAKRNMGAPRVRGDEPAGTDAGGAIVSAGGGRVSSGRAASNRRKLVPPALTTPRRGVKHMKLRLLPGRPGPTERVGPAAGCRAGRATAAGVSRSHKKEDRQSHRSTATPPAPPPGRG